MNLLFKTYIFLFTVAILMATLVVDQTEAGLIEKPILPFGADNNISSTIENSFDFEKRSKQKFHHGNQKYDPWRIGDLSPDKWPDGKKSSTLEVPPAHPINLAVDNESMHVVLITWDDPKSTPTPIDNYVVKVGTTPGMTDVLYQAFIGNKAYFYPLEKGLQEGDTIYVSVQSYNVDSQQYSEETQASPLVLNYEPLGEADNQLKVNFADYGYDTDGVTKIAGWDEAEVDHLEHFTSRMIPILKDIYGAPSHDFTVTIVKNLFYSSSNIYFPQYNEIHMANFGFLSHQILTHELIHAFRDNVIISSNEFWQYDPTYSGFEEGFAQGVSYEAMNRYIKLYPDDPYVLSSYVWNSDFEWDYHFQNVPELGTTDFWSDQGGMNLFWVRYEMAAAAIRKMHIENERFFKNFNKKWYDYLNSDHKLISSKDLIIKIICEVLGNKIEGVAVENWINQQYIFDSKITIGKKIWVNTEHDPIPWDDLAYQIKQKGYYYETFENGSDWSYWDGEKYVYYSLNGSEGVGSLTDLKHGLFWKDKILIKPLDNPPVYFGFGWADLNMVNVDEIFSLSFYIEGLHDLQLYKMDVSFEEVQKTIYRVIGDELAPSNGIWGGVIGAIDGEIYIDHEDYPEEDGLDVVNGAFHGDRNWAGIFNVDTGNYETIPGKLKVRYENAVGDIYRTEVNIGSGNTTGNQMFLFDFTQPN